MSLGTIKDYTPNFNLIIPEFNISGWHDYLEENFRSIDALFYNLFGINNYSGIWEKLTSYTAGQVVFIGEDTNYSGRLVKVLVNHTTTNDDFTTFFTNNPTYYEFFADASTAQYYAQQAKDWAVKMNGPVEGSNYSAKYYADMVDSLSTEITALYNIASDIQTIASISADVKNVADNKTNINTVASNISDINTVSSNITNINNVNDNLTDINAVSSNISAVNTTATNATNITTVANNVTDINTVASISSNVTSVAGNATNINTVANNNVNITAVSQNLTNINTVASNQTNINTTATNISAINTNASNITAIQNALTNATNAQNSAQSAAFSAEQAAISAAGTHFKLFQHNWFDYLLNDMAWLRADTFSWQDGTVYTAAYNHLSADISGKTLQSETIGAVTIQFYLADDGHKICPASEESNIASIYTNTGVSWYYILDTTNERFKLPRINPDRKGLIQVVRAKGNGKSLGLSDGNYNAGLRLSGNNTSLGVYNNSYDISLPSTNSDGSLTFLAYSVIGLTSDSTKSGIISDMSESTSVYAGQKYLYFYVGDYTQTAIEQTAGLNAELFNNKADIDLSNSTVPHIVETYVNGTSWYRIYSDGWVEQGGSVSTNGDTTITFMVEMADTNYFVTKTNTLWNTNNMWNKGNSYTDKSTTSIQLCMLQGGCWEVKGYKAQGENL